MYSSVTTIFVYFMSSKHNYITVSIIWYKILKHYLINEKLYINNDNSVDSYS